MINKAPSMPTKDQQDNQTNDDTEQRTNGLIHPHPERVENGGESPTGEGSQFKDVHDSHNSNSKTRNDNV